MCERASKESVPDQFLCISETGVYLVGQIYSWWKGPCKIRQNYRALPCVFVFTAPRIQFPWCSWCSVAICCLRDGKVVQWQLWPIARFSSNLQQPGASPKRATTCIWLRRADRCQNILPQIWRVFSAGNMRLHKRIKEINCVLVFRCFIFTILLKIKNIIKINNEVKNKSLKKSMKPMTATFLYKTKCI